MLHRMLSLIGKYQCYAILSVTESQIEKEYQNSRIYATLYSLNKQINNFPEWNTDQKSKGL